MALVDGVTCNTPSISLAMNTRNEEAKISSALQSAVGVDEIVVADMESSDRTVEICSNAGARILRLPNYGYCEPGRQTVIDAATSDWVLVLDGDERLSPGGVDTLRSLARQADPSIAAFLLPTPTHLGNYEIRGTGWQIRYERHPRFFRREAVTWPREIHGVPRFIGAVVDLPTGSDVSILHYCFDSITHAWQKFNLYSTQEAVENCEAGRKSTWLGGLMEAIREFVRRYEPQEDGGVSFALSFGLFFYRLSVHMKSLEISQALVNEAVPQAKSMQAAWQAFIDELTRQEVAHHRVQVGQYLNNGDLLSAQSELNRALATWGDNSELLVEAAVLAAQCGAARQAEALCDRVLASDPSHAEARTTKLALDVATGKREPVTCLVLGTDLRAGTDEVVVVAPGISGGMIEAPYDQLPFAPGSLETIRVPEDLLRAYERTAQERIASHLQSLLKPGGQLIFESLQAVG